MYLLRKLSNSADLSPFEVWRRAGSPVNIDTDFFLQLQVLSERKGVKNLPYFSYVRKHPFPPTGLYGH